ncbi:MAG: hypothetical protein KC620_17625, partial [Myxococcales bacterium]|nr:hypothetical protein [Myxococcales bacterium]
MKAHGPARLGVFGASGRLGRRVIECLPEHAGLKLVEAIGRDAPPGAFGDCDVVIDVSLAEATGELLARLEGTAAALVTGVTGRDAAQIAALEARAAHAPVLFAANFSVGVAMLQRLVRAAAAALGPDFEAEVFEVHHRHKRDAPSGTALALARAAAEGAGPIRTQRVDATGRPLGVPRAVGQSASRLAIAPTFAGYAL